ncbi:MAG: CaiB/BaiF CoA-transferase family protein [Aeromicrobium sp.]|uniref:CaiB/BaiF CoA transferase family protein n=1 Tax=Aeromicrobium sp. TaxID=1871063 RepID=UPI002602AF17|nr:CaiB/BaiF CoA-transferase family protein [Aeromicrobium sp.]MDF1705945.1 CaiB/BaiF CoA-transferase family protein [Aeromicrobium sp.]
MTVKAASDTARPLAGLRVVSMAEQYPGPYATMIMSDLGADVIIVERPGAGDPARQFPPFFAALNRGKRSVAIDMKKPEGVAALRRLVASADIFLEGFRPGTADRLGIGWEDLRAVNDALVYVSISGFGQDGPYRLRPAHDLSYQAAAGLLGKVETPWRLSDPLATADLSSGLFAVVGCLSALRQRDSTGQGSYIDVAMMDSLVALMATNLHPAANGIDHVWIEDEPGYGVYATLDGHITLSLSYEDWFWASTCITLELPDLASLTADQRRGDSEAIRARLQERLLTNSNGHWARLFAETDVPFAVVATVDDVVKDPQVVARGMIAPVDSDGVRYVRQPLTIDGRRSGPLTGVPQVGGDSVSILAEAGLGHDVIQGLLDAGVVAVGDTTSQARVDDDSQHNTEEHK